MKLKITVQSKGGHSWAEEYDKPHIKTQHDAEVWAQQTIGSFNATLRPGERPRTLVSVSLEGVSTAHVWVKTSLATVHDGLGLYDRMQCEVCRITGKRFGLNQNIKIDSKFRAKKYLLCKPGERASASPGEVRDDKIS